MKTFDGTVKLNEIHEKENPAKPNQTGLHPVKPNETQ